MKRIVVNYSNKLKGVHIVETVDVNGDKYVLVEKVEVLKKYVRIICPYVDLKKLLMIDDRTVCIRCQKLIDDEIEFLNDQYDYVTNFSIEIDDDRYIKIPSDEI
jgi:hypothetical protein